MPSFAVAAEELRAKLQLASAPAEEEDEDDDDGVDLYKGSFSLAYGTLTLLRETKMHLKRPASTDYLARTSAARRP